jgi:hypothetical protein
MFHDPTPMSQTLCRDTGALTATNPEHCLDRFRLIRPVEAYHQGWDGTVTLPNVRQQPAYRRGRRNDPGA